MKEQLRTTPCLTARRMYTGLYIFFLMICGAAYSQPTMLSPIPSASRNFVYVNGSLYYSNGSNLYKGTSTSAPALVTTTGETILSIYDITLGSNFFFVTQASSGQRLWRTDGTAANTAQVTTATEIVPLLVYNSELFLGIKSDATGRELWKMDAAYTVTIVKDINPGIADGFIGYPGNLIVHNNLLHFFATEGIEENLWRSNGTTAGTFLSADIDDTEVYRPARFSGLTSYNNALYFTRNHEDPEYGDRISELWKSDGTTGGTNILVTYGGGNSWNYMSNFTVFNGKLYFFHSLGDPPYLWLSVTDGTASGTQHLDLVTIDGELVDLANAEDYLLYFADTQGFPLPLQKFDGTTASGIHQFYEGDRARKEDIDLTYTEGRAFFIAYEETYDYPQAEKQLWQADLASATTRPVTEIYDGIPLHGTETITAADGSIFFTRHVSGQTTLWYYDPASSPSTCGGTGNILQEIWTNVTGTDVRTFDFSTPPTGGSRSFTSFETTQYYANNYASRMRGTICVPQTGLYTFWISSDDYSELYLSTNAFEEDKRVIAWVYGHTPFRNYDKYPSQKSIQIYLRAGRKYYIEARHKEGTGNDFVSVGWQLPDGTMERPIAGSRLNAITTPPNAPPVITITNPQDGETFPSSAPINITADVTDPDGVYNVRFVALYSNGSRSLASFSAPPYQYTWNNAPPGDYEIRVDATDNLSAESHERVFITVQEPPCTGTGTIVREVWFGVPGTALSTIPNRYPDRHVQLTSLATSNYYGNEYVSRIRGYVCVPATGAYTFWISGDDNSELWLSNNDDPAGKNRIAYVTSATRVDQWTKYSTQQSALVNLVQGQRYYIEVLHKEGNGADHVEVGWQLPSGAFERPIPGSRLIPFEDPSTSAARFAVEDVISFGEEEGTFTVYPNPATSGQQVSIKLPGATDSDVQVDIKSITGVSVQNEILSSSGEAVTIDLKPSIAAGMYLIRVSSSKKRWATKLQVK